MKRKDYKKPTTTIVRLQHQSSILVGSQDIPTQQEDVEDYIINDERQW